METTRFTGLLVNQTGQDIRGMIENAVRDAGYGPLPEEIADLFSVSFLSINREEWLILDMAD